MYTSESEERESLKGLQTEALQNTGSDVSVRQFHRVEDMLVSEKEAFYKFKWDVGHGM
jgi:hypothetical protein